jgi:hypothetical protein
MPTCVDKIGTYRAKNKSQRERNIVSFSASFPASNLRVWSSNLSERAKKLNNLNELWQDDGTKF